MKRLMLISTALGCLLAYPTQAQTFQQCADMNSDGHLDIVDMVFMIEIFRGEMTLQAGKGDVDFRQNFNLGDFRYFVGYIFQGYPEGGCPPFPFYTLQDPGDSLLLPRITVGPGSGSVVVPIIIANHQLLSDLLVYCQLNTSGVTAQITDIEFTAWDAGDIHFDNIVGADISIMLGGFEPGHQLAPGTNSIAAVHINYSSGGGGTISLDPASFGPYRFIHEVYGDLALVSYNAMSIGLPTVLVMDTPGIGQLSVVPDTLHFVSVVDWPNPDPQTFEVLSSGPAFAWTATFPSWLNVTPTSGLSGATVSVQPISGGLAAGTYSGIIEVSATPAYDTPKNVQVIYRVLPQYPSLDANCDGSYTISDIVAQLNYIFAGGPLCDPCSK